MYEPRWWFSGHPSSTSNSPTTRAQILLDADKKAKKRPELAHLNNILKLHLPSSKLLEKPKVFELFSYALCVHIFRWVDEKDTEPLETCTALV